MRISHDFSFLLQLGLKGGAVHGWRHPAFWPEEPEKRVSSESESMGLGRVGKSWRYPEENPELENLLILWVTFHMSWAHYWAGMHRTDLRHHSSLHKWNWGRSPPSQKVRQNLQSEPYWVDCLTKQSNKMFPHPPSSNKIRGGISQYPTLHNQEDPRILFLKKKMSRSQPPDNPDVRIIRCKCNYYTSRDKHTWTEWKKFSAEKLWRESHRNLTTKSIPSDIKNKNHYMDNRKMEVIGVSKLEGKLINVWFSCWL